MRLVFQIIAAIFLAGNLLAVGLPVGRPDTEGAYAYLRELYLRGADFRQGAMFGPVESKSIKDHLSAYGRELHISGRLEAILDRFLVGDNTLRFQTSLIPYGIVAGDTGRLYWSIIPEAIWGLGKNLNLHLAYRSDSRLTRDESYIGRKWDNWAGYAETGLLVYHSPRLSIELGRRRSFWGIAKSGHTLMHASTAMPLDGLFLGYRISRRVSAHASIAYLSPIYYPPGQPRPDNDENRYFSAHALSISAADWLDITLKESIIYGGPGRRLESYYALPFLWLHAEQLNANADDNTLFGIEAIWRYRSRLAGYVDFMLDDLQIEKKSGSDREPAEYGVIFGLKIFDLGLSPSALEFEYARIANRTYNQLNPRNRYIHQNRALGYPLGPDNESISIGYNWHVSRRLTLGVDYFYGRMGEGKIDSPWLTPWVEDPGYSEKFPSGIVQKERRVGVRGIFQNGAQLESKLSLNFADINNDKNIPGNNRGFWSVSGEIIYNLPIFSWRLDHE